jgi:hypothetical protein
MRGGEWTERRREVAARTRATTIQRTRGTRQEMGVRREVEAPMVGRQWRYEMPHLTREPEGCGEGQRRDERRSRRRTGGDGGDVSGPEGDCCTVIARMDGNSDGNVDCA